MGNRLQDKVALITGGTSGIGEATAELFVAEGARVVITGRSEAKGGGIADRLGEHCVYVRADVNREADIAASVDATLERFGKLDVLFNNAGAGVQTTLDTITAAQIEEGVRLLLSSVMLGIRYAVAPMKANGGGAIINNSSIAGLRYRQGDLLYSAIKAGVTHYSKLAGVELGPYGIRVNVISPGAIATPIFWGGSERANTLSDEENARKMAKLQRNLAKATPMRASGLAVDIAEAALYLASDAGRFVNAHDLIVDGGRTSMFEEQILEE
ncbi:MAG: SDR family oxidoreductase [Chloroflexota bacterium]|nr:SDR family oxidoreductase [Chloroflexota bacterium]